MDKMEKDIPSRESSHVQKSKIVNDNSTEFADVKLRLKEKGRTAILPFSLLETMIVKLIKLNDYFLSLSPSM